MFKTIFQLSRTKFEILIKNDLMLVIASMIGYNHRANNPVYFLFIERSSPGAAISMVSYVEELAAGAS